MRRIGIIGGTGLVNLAGLEVERREIVETPFGLTSGPLLDGKIFGREVTFLPRHGEHHTVLPHRINYRANLWALKARKIHNIIATAAVGGIHPEIPPQWLCIPDQIIDYTWGREQTYYNDAEVVHIDFTSPYCDRLRDSLTEAARRAGLDIYEGGTYAAVQGPRLETSAEIDKLERDGCDIVGMTGMPEAALARELELCYATCAVCANRAAGRGADQITLEEIEENLKQGMKQLVRLLAMLLRG